MRHMSTVIVGGIAAMALAGSMAMAAQPTAPTHEMTILLPGGGVEHVRYSGDVAPQLVIDPAPFGAAWAQPMGFWQASSFANIGRIMAHMDRQMEAMVRHAQSMAAAPVPGSPGPIETAFGKLPAGTMSYSVVSVSNGHGTCTRTVETSMVAGNTKPQTVSHQSGDCRSAHAGTPAGNGNTTTL